MEITQWGCGQGGSAPCPALSPLDSSGLQSAGRVWVQPREARCQGIHLFAQIFLERLCSRNWRYGREDRQKMPALLGSPA